MSSNQPHASDAVAPSGALRACKQALGRAALATVLAVSLGFVVRAEGPLPLPSVVDSSSALPEPKDAGGMFLPSENGRRLWQHTLATVAADWPIVRTLEPDFTATPPREGLIESAWVEPPARASSSSAGQRTAAACLRSV